MGGGGGGGAGGSAHLNIIDEDEWTDLNFGNNSTNCANTSDDSISDLDSDQGCQLFLVLCYPRLFVN